MREKIDPFEYASHILRSLSSGILLTSRNGSRVNTMTIGWGALGIDWQRPIFTTYVRTGRFTYSCLQAVPEFTINVPAGPYDRKILAVAGTKSGHDIDKIATLGLHLEEPERISVPAIRELPLTLECAVIYRQLQDPAAIPAALREGFHPQNIDSSAPGINRDYHTAFYGEILSAYIIR